MATARGGGGSDAPDDASEKDFCEAVEAAPSDEKPSQDDVDEWVDKLKDAGTPDDIDDEDDRADVTKFFSYYVKTCADVGGDLPTELPSDFPTDIES